MKKFLFGIALVFSVLVIATGFNNAPDNIKLSIGSAMPSIQVVNSEKTIVLGGTKENYTLVTFWETLDAQSRIDCTRYNNYFELEQPHNIDFVAINFDKNEILRNEIIQNDGLQATCQYRADTETAIELRAAFSLDEGMGSLLLDDKGVIVAFNPTIDDLNRLTMN